MNEKLNRKSAELNSLPFPMSSGSEYGHVADPDLSVMDYWASENWDVGTVAKFVFDI
jgi:hypothetical protein